MRVGSALGIVVLTLACRPNTNLSVEVPPDVRYAAVLQLDGDTLVAATPLLSWSEDEGLPVFADGARRHVVVGYGALDLADDDRPFTQPLEPAPSPCAAQLPTPLWAADLAGASVDASALTPLTAPWLSDACAPLDDDLWIENLCGNRRCTIDRIDTTACTRTYSLAACQGPEAITVSRRADRSLCATSDADLDACPYVFHDIASGPAPFTIERRVLVAGEDIAPIDRPTPVDRERGTLLDFAFVGDAILVAARATPNDDCEAGATRRLFVLDADDLSVRDTIAIDGCLERLERIDSGAFAVGATGDRWALFTFDATGTRTATAAIPVIDFPIVDYRVVDVLPAGDLAYVVFAARVDRDAPYRLAAVEVDTRTLQIQRIFDRTEPRETWRVVLREDKLVAAGLGQQSFVEIGLAGNGASATSVPHEYTGGEINDLYVAGATLAVSLRQVLHVYGERVLRRPVFTQSDVVAVHDWSDDLRLVVELQYLVEPRESEAVFYDERRDRLLPGRWPIGPSIPGRIRTDDSGRVVMLLPWVGQIVRLTETP